MWKQPKNYQDRKRQKVSGNQTDTVTFKVTWLEIFYFSLENMKNWNFPLGHTQGKSTRKLLYQIHLPLPSYCQTKYDNQN